jgi:glycosyltransferase involved in cell wall biosynthesis
MKIGIFLEKFTDTEINKDPGVIIEYLQKNNISTKIFSQFASAEVMSRYNVEIINARTRNTKEYWEKANIDVLIIYSWLSLRYSKMILAAKQANLKIILKLDSDGYLMSPFYPSYLKVFGLENNILAKIKHLVRLVQWRLFGEFFSKKRLKQVEMCDAAIIESPQARLNIEISLDCFKKLFLIEKIKIIPNPVIDISTYNNEKENIITCIGRWDDNRKNSPALLRVLSNFHHDWKIIIIGKGANEIGKKIKKINNKIDIESSEKISHQEVINKLSQTKIFFSPSISESFNLSAAEALCCGCSLVGSPLPSFDYFIKNNFSGTLAEDLKAASFLKSLESDIEKWNNNLYQPSKIAEYWQYELSPNKIAKQIINLAQSLCK